MTTNGWDHRRQHTARRVRSRRLTDEETRRPAKKLARRSRQHNFGALRSRRGRKHLIHAAIGQQVRGFHRRKRGVIERGK